MGKTQAVGMGALAGLGLAGGLAGYFYRRAVKARQTTVGIICAMESEVAPLREAMTIARRTVVSGLTFYQGTLESTPVVLVQCGVGKVNAALCAEALCTVFEVDALINTGVAGTPHREVSQRDIVISTQAVQHDVDATIRGFARGEVPDMDIIYFPADDDLVELARKAALSLDLEGAKVFTGTVASGDQFIADAAASAAIAKHFAPRAVEMEGAAIAQVAWVNAVPYVIIRSITDNADGDAPLSFDAFEPIAAAHSSAVVRAMLALGV